MVSQSSVQCWLSAKYCSTAFLIVSIRLDKMLRYIVLTANGFIAISRDVTGCSISFSYSNPHGCTLGLCWAGVLLDLLAVLDLASPGQNLFYLPGK